MKLAILYAGQGSQHPGMGKDLYERYPEFQEAFNAADLDFDLESVCFDDPEGVLNLTQYTQPCMVAFAAGITAVLKENGIKADYLAGLSLGEYSALEAAGVFTAKQAVELAAFRGKAMADAAKGIECGMTAVMNLDRDALAKCCEEASVLGCVQICNYNCPGQIVITGYEAAVAEASEKLKEAGAKRVLPLNVSGPFHSPMMEAASQGLTEALEGVGFMELKIPYVTNVTGQYVRDTALTRGLLIQQVASGVRWQQSIEAMIADGVDTFVEIGPGRTLTGFLRKINRDEKGYNIRTYEEMHQVCETLL